MNILLLLLIVFNLPVLAGEPLNTESFIQTFQPESSYNFQGEVQDATPKQRIPIDKANESSVTTPIHDLNKKLEVLSALNNSPYNSLSILLPLGVWVYDKRFEIALISILGIGLLGMVTFLHQKNFWQRTLQRFSNLIAITFPSLSGFNVNAHELSEQVQREQTNSLSTIQLPPFYSSLEAADPFHESIPDDVTEVYTWSPEWNPLNRPYDFLQCTTFVAMTYNLNGINLKGKLIGDARDWIHLTDTFDVHAANVSRTIPQPMDTMVWTENGANHVGIVTAVAADRTFQVANGNSTQAVHTYKYHINPDGTVTITNVAGKSAKEAWVPSHWLRLKKKR